MTGFIHQRRDWPHFEWDYSVLARRLAAVHNRQGRLSGRMEEFGFRLRAEANLEALTEEVTQTSDIEGEKLSRIQVRSSIARRLGVDIGVLCRTERHVDVVVEMVLDATGKYATP